MKSTVIEDVQKSQMQWFPGPYGLACQVTQKNKALLVVFVDDGSENSKKMSSFWEQISQKDFGCPVVAFHLKTSDESFKNFTYPTLVLPTTYFIDETSTVVKILTLADAGSFDDFSSQIRQIIEEFKSKKCCSKSIKPNVNSNTSQPQTSLDEKVRRAKDLLEKKRLDDEAKEKAEQKKMELDRIRSGKLMQDAAQKRQEQEIAESAAQRRREKLQAEAEKERVRAQIKADREEREFRQQRGAQQSTEPAKLAEEARQTTRIESDRCRVQVRLPDNKTFVEEFASADKLSVLFDRIKSSGEVSGSFNLVQPYPRHVYTAEEMDKSFFDLFLTPSCNLAIEQKKSGASAIVPSNPLGLLSYLFSLLILSPLSYGFALIRSLFGGRKNASTSSQKKDETSGGRPRAAPGGDATVRRRGNVSGLDNPNGNDDPEARWNGNSTQFM